jgi:tRNA nucleotidyltransferase (CCA-adding enzyme)
MSDYNFLMETRLSADQYAVLGLVSRLAAEHGMNIYLVGGAVRDLTYGQQVVRDLDFIVEGSPQKILRAIPHSDSGKTNHSGRGPAGETTPALEFQSFDEALNSAELLFSNGVRAELAMSRELVPRPGERPQVVPAMVFEDLKRRDFAINAMAVSLHPNSRGLLLDPTNGAGDIERHEIRALQSHGFEDDPTRIFRLLRLGMRLDFKPEERTQRWFDAAVAERGWERLDADQQSRELAAILHEDQPGRVLKMLSDKNLLAGLDKKLASASLSLDRFARIRSVLQNVPGADPFLLNFDCLVEKLAEDQKARLAKRIVGDSKSIKLALGMENEAKKLERTLSSSKAELPSQVYATLSPQPQPLLLYLLASTKSTKIQNRVKNFLFKFPQIQSQLPVAELQSMGVKPGPEFDRIISKIFAMQLDGKIKSHPQLLKEMRELAGIKEPPPPPPQSQKKRKEIASEAATAQKKGKAVQIAPPASQPAKAKPVVTAPRAGRSASPAQHATKEVDQPRAPAVGLVQSAPTKVPPAAKPTPRLHKKLKQR